MGVGESWSRVRRASRLLALCLHAKLQIPGASRRPGATLHVSVHVSCAVLSWSAFTSPSVRVVRACVWEMVGVYRRLYRCSCLWAFTQRGIKYEQAGGEAAFLV